MINRQLETVDEQIQILKQEISQLKKEIDSKVYELEFNYYSLKEKSKYFKSAYERLLESFLEYENLTKQYLSIKYEYFGEEKKIK